MTRPLRVLVVDDNPDIVQTMSALLKLEGHDAQGCYSGADVWQCVCEYDPDAVLLDIGLPGKNGWEVAGEIRSRVPGRRPLIIAITGEYTKQTDQALAHRRGFDHYLVKPADPKVLMALLAKAT